MASGDVVGYSQTLRYLGQAYLDMGRRDQALSELEQADTIADTLHRPRLSAQTRY